MSPGNKLMWQSFSLQCMSHIVKPTFEVYMETSGFEH
jgi:hypothetical protein